MNNISQLRNPEQIRNQCRLTGFLITNSSTELICYKKKQKLGSFIMSGCPCTQNRTRRRAAGFTYVTVWMLSICFWTLVTCWYQAGIPSFYILLDEGHGSQHHSVIFYLKGKLLSRTVSLVSRISPITTMMLMMMKKKMMLMKKKNLTTVPCCPQGPVLEHCWFVP